MKSSTVCLITIHTNSSSEFSTIDTTILVLGALFAGNYFGGEVESLALQLRDATQWSDAIKLVEIVMNTQLVTEYIAQVREQSEDLWNGQSQNWSSGWEYKVRSCQ